MRGRVVGLAAAAAGVIQAMRCIGPPDVRGPLPPDPMVGVKPWIPPLPSTPSPFVRTPFATFTPTPPPEPTPAHGVTPSQETSPPPREPKASGSGQ